MGGSLFLAIVLSAGFLLGCARHAPPPPHADNRATTLPTANVRLSNLDLQTSSLPEPAVVEVYDVSDGKRIGSPQSSIFGSDTEPPPQPAPEDLARSFPIRPYGPGVLIEIKRFRTLRGDDARHFARLWRQVEFVDNPGMMCHHPPYAFRCLDANGRIMFETSVCWGCSNFFLRRGDGDHTFYGFSPSSPGATALLEHCKQITTDAQSHIPGQAGAPAILNGELVPYMPDALDRFGEKRNNATDEDLLTLEGFASLQSLSVFSHEVTDRGIAVLKTLPGLRGLTLRTPAVTPAGLSALRTLTQLEELSLIEMPVNDEVLADIAKLARLQGLWISRNDPAGPSPSFGVTDAGLVHLRQLRELRSLALEGTSITDAGLANLADLRQLKDLTLSHTRVTGTGLSALHNLPQLEELSLSHAKVTNDGVAVIARLPALEQLNLESNATLTDAGLTPLANAAKLYRLNVEMTPIGDAGLKHLVAMPSLSHLHLKGTAITDAALPLLAKMPKLTVVWVGETKVTEEAIERMGESRPGLTLQQ